METTPNVIHIQKCYKALCGFMHGSNVTIKYKFPPPHMLNIQRIERRLKGNCTSECDFCFCLVRWALVEKTDNKLHVELNFFGERRKQN